MGSSDSHDAFTQPAENAPKHDDAFTQSKKDAPRGADNFTQSFKDGLAYHWSQTCEHEFKFMRNYMKGFGARFDELTFPSFETGEAIKGSELRDCQTGCEMLEKREFHKHGAFAHLERCGCKQFDEQLQFVNDKGTPLSNVDYCITRADGMEIKGTTDNEGKTRRIKNTQQEMAIEKVEFFATTYTQPLCPQSRVPVGTLLASLELSDVKTTDVNVGSSVRKITLKGEDRPLTAGEIQMASLVFKDSINYDDVKIHKGKFWLTFGYQEDNEAIVPFGKMYFPDDKFREDFSIEKDSDKIWFMHEMTHVWQYQLGMCVLFKALLLRIDGGYDVDKSGNPVPKGYRYDPVIDNRKTLPDFNFEQQAELISHYYAARYLKLDFYLNRRPFLENVLKDFLITPRNKSLLPRKYTSPRIHY